MYVIAENRINQNKHKFLSNTRMKKMRNCEANE